MSKKIYLIITGLFLIVLASAQEKLFLRTDRDYYVGGEDAWINITNVKEGSNEASGLSKVVYLELLNSDNKPILQKKLRLEDSEVTSVVNLPDTLSSANYSFRAYTRWMRNGLEDQFVYKNISVISPFSKNAIPGHDETIKVEKKKDNKKSLETNAEGFVQLNLNEQQFKNRDKVIVTYRINKQYAHGLKFLTIRVIKSTLVYDTNNPAYPGKSFSGPAKNIEPSQEPFLLPDLKGEWLTGTITHTETGKPVTNEKMVLNFVGNSPVMHFSTTDSLGRFGFVVNQYEKKEMVIQPFHLDTANINYKVTIDPGYSLVSPDFEMVPLNLSKEKAMELNRAIINMQINTIYSSYRSDIERKDSMETALPFYGLPEILVPIDKFIDLPNIEEIIKEIVPYTALRKNKNNYFFKVFESQSSFPRDGETLTMVDGVPIYHINDILEINPKDLDRIEVVNLNYYMEDENLGRLLCFYTVKGNMGAMDFDHRIFRQAREGYLPSYSYISPDYSTPEKRKSRLADYRNILYFGAVTIPVDQKGEISFYTSDDKGEYTIIVEGIDAKGKLVSASTSFTVQ